MPSKYLSEKTSLVTIFEQIRYDENLLILIPIKTSLGEMDQNSYTFFDYMDGTIYSNSDLRWSDEGKVFNLSNKLIDLIVKYDTNDIKTIINKEITKFNNKVFFYKNDDYVLKTLSIKKFYEKFNCSCTYKVDYGSNLKLFKEFQISDLGTIEQKMCLFEQIQEVEEENEKIKTENENKQILTVNINEAYSKIKNSVLSQDQAIKKILTSIYKNMLFDNTNIKTNLFIYGPTGVGKTSILRHIEKIFNVPVVIADMNEYTVAGYVGKSVDDLLKDLYYKADCNLELAQHGILCLDEIDKKGKNGENSNISSEGVLNSLLKIIEGGTFKIVNPDSSPLYFDTSNLTIIASGAFTNMKSSIKTNIGFGSINETRDNYKTEDFISYGMPREFMGRFNSIVKLNSLTKENLKDILLNSESSCLKISQEELKKYNIYLNIPDKLIDQIVECAYKENIGARALNRLLSQILDDAIFDAFSQKDNVPLKINFQEDLDVAKTYKIQKKNI